MEAFVRAIRTQGIPLVICVVFSLAIIVPDQSLEIFRYCAQSIAQFSRGYKEWANLHDLIATVLAVSAFSLTLFTISALLATQIDDASRKNGFTWAERGFCVGISVVPPLATAFGFLSARIDLNAPDLQETLRAGSELSYKREYDNLQLIKTLASKEVASQLQINNWLISVAGLLFVLAAAFTLVFLLLLRSDRFLRSLAETAWPRLLLISLAAILVPSLAFALFPVSLAQALTPFGVICLFFLVATLVLSFAALFAAKTGFPLGLTAVGLALLFGLLGLNDNHKVRTVSSIGSQEARSATKVAEGFKQWFEHRRDKDRYGVYPVYIVATEGGGIYAAFRTATFLSSIQDQCPRFSEHLFAISSVSGGSIGASVFASLTQKMKESGNRFDAGLGCRKEGEDAGNIFLTDMSEVILMDDFLSPVLGSFLFPDLLQRFLPFTVPSFDRARALETGLEGSWDKWAAKYRAEFPLRWSDAGAPLKQPFSDQWRADGNTPALFINTTEVGSGRGRVIAPFELRTEQFSTFPLREGQAGAADRELPLSAAAILSARFPWLTPAGWFQQPIATDTANKQNRTLDKKVYLVDGGYFDNSGIITAQAIMAEIERAVKEIDPPIKVQINLIVLTSKDFGEPSVIAGDYLLPVEALLSARAARGRIAVEQAEREYGAGAATSARLRKAELEGFGYPLPLGWRLSPITRLLILGENGSPADCAPGSDNSAKRNASCLKKDIFEDMSR